MINMHLSMAGIDARTGTVEQREAFAFSVTQIKQILADIMRIDNVHGAVLLATCNRTELYLSIEEPEETRADAVLKQYALFPIEDVSLYVQEESQAVQHIMEVACGIHSKILHEEQIVTQVGHAAQFARCIVHSTDALLDTLFRIAVSAGKYALTNVVVSHVPLSVSYSAVALLEKECGSLSGKKSVVVGNGKMGRLAAELLVQKGCEVYVTLRTYHHGETIVPFGTKPIPYEERFSKIDGADIVFSATKSPHYTITESQICQLTQKPKWILDLAMPRDVESSCGTINGVTLYNIDDFGENMHPTQEAVAMLQSIAEQYADAFRMWRNYRESVPYIQQLKWLTAERLLHSTAMKEFQGKGEVEEIVRFVTGKTVDMIMGSIKSDISPELLRNCCNKIGERARAVKK